MNYKKNIFILALIVAVVASCLLIYRKKRSPHTSTRYLTTKPQKKTIVKDIRTRGTLAIGNTSKIGSLITGTVKTIHVQEHDHVQAGQLLLEIDNGKGTSEVEESRGEVMQAQAKYDFLAKHVARQKKLFEHGQLAQDKYEEKVRDLHEAQGGLVAKKARLEKRTIEYNNTRIYAPQDGTITRIGVSQGERVTTDLNATVLFEIAKDTQNMIAHLQIDEANIGQIALSQAVTMVVDAYPHHTIEGTIVNIGTAPKKEENNTYYTATVALNPVNLKLFPGMKVHATIPLAQANDVLSIPATAFLIDQAPVQQLAELENLSFEPLNNAQKQQLKVDSGDKPLLFAWVCEPTKIRETAVTCGLDDYATYEVCCGLSSDDRVIIDLPESSEMASTYKNLFTSAI